ncbi:MAG: type VI secretion system ImpA family N-terminal domain-containing protein [Treponema sp.]|nr:type VI secretion system ImpA family N-terminal domain-containing protein [Treponema sp.]
MIDIDEMAVPLSGDSLAGINAEYDPLYTEMESLAVAVPDSQMGDSIIAGRDPDWKKLNKHCLELWKKTRDLRVASYLVIAQTALDGLAGLVSTLKLLVFLVKDMWDACYPQLDPEDDNDPSERFNILAMLSPDAGAINDPIMFISRLREVRLVPSLGYTLRDLVSSDGGDNALDLVRFMQASITEIQERAALGLEAKEQIEALCNEMNGKMQGGYLLNMASLTHEVDRFRSFYDTCLQSVGASDAAVDAGVPVFEGAAGTSSGSVNLVSAGTRAEALLLLKKGAEYFQRQEPNSPIPLLINRALRFSEMTFMDLLEDIAPDAVSRGRDILGIKPEE